MKVYVTDRKGKFLPGIGQRDYGDYFQMTESFAQRFLAMAGFSESNPIEPKPKTKKKTADKLAEQE